MSLQELAAKVERLEQEVSHRDARISALASSLDNLTASNVNGAFGRFSAALSAYTPAFTCNNDEEFLTYYGISKDKTIYTKDYTRGQFFTLALQAANLLAQNGLGKGDMVCHYFSDNTVEDLAFRLAATMLGTIPVTINWQADPLERILYKIELTESKMVLVDAGTNPENIAQIEAKNPSITVFDVTGLPSTEPMDLDECDPAVDLMHPHMVIFTSGTTGNPKGVLSTYRAYDTNRATFESLLQLEGPGTYTAFIIVNPMHHTNSTAITDWALRRPHARLHLCQRYSTRHWQTMEAVYEQAMGASSRARVVAPMVSRHFDFLESLVDADKLPVDPAKMKAVLEKLDILIGSAPVGPTTVQRLMKFAGTLPHVRFGSTETCLQVLGTPLTHSSDERLAAFEAGWGHTWEGVAQTGYYVGRPTPPHTDFRIVKSVDTSSADYFVDCEEGQPGYLICKGHNVMKGYVKNAAATEAAIHDGGWYTKFGDVCFWLTHPSDGGRDVYWLSRDSHLLIRGGANYSYEQINAELQACICDAYGLENTDVNVAVVGVNITSEHEDDCYLTVELVTENAKAKEREIESSLMEKCKAGVSKAAKPQYIRYNTVAKNFKGAILYNVIKKQSLFHYEMQPLIAEGGIDRSALEDEAAVISRLQGVSTFDELLSADASNVSTVITETAAKCDQAGGVSEQTIMVLLTAALERLIK